MDNSIYLSRSTLTLPIVLLPIDKIVKQYPIAFMVVSISLSPGGKCSDPEQEPSENYFALEGKWQLLTDGTRFKIKGDTQLEQMKELEGSVWAEPVSITILGR